MVSPCGDDFFVGATFGRPHGLYKFKPCRSQKRAVEGASPYNCAIHSTAAKSLSLFADFTLCRKQQKRCRLVLRFLLCDRRTFDILLFLSAPLSRLAPIEALPQTPLGALPLDPTSPLAPGLTLRFISRDARFFISLHTCAQLWSAMPIPHS